MLREGVGYHRVQILAVAIQLVVTRQNAQPAPRWESALDGGMLLSRL